MKREIDHLEIKDLEVTQKIGRSGSGLYMVGEVNAETDGSTERHLHEGTKELSGTEIHCIQDGLQNRARKLVAADDGIVPVNCGVGSGELVHKGEERNPSCQDFEVSPSDYFQDVYSRQMVEIQDKPKERGKLSLCRSLLKRGDSVSWENCLKSCDNFDYCGKEQSDPDGGILMSANSTCLDNEHSYDPGGGIAWVCDSTRQNGEELVDPARDLMRSCNDRGVWEEALNPVRGLLRRCDGSSRGEKKLSDPGEGFLQDCNDTGRGWEQLRGRDDTGRGSEEQFDQGGSNRSSSFNRSSRRRKPKIGRNCTAHDSQGPSDLGGRF